jgi:protein CpxP
MKKKIAIALVALTGLGLTVGIAGCNEQDPEEQRVERVERAHSFVTERVDDVLDDVEATSEQRTEVHVIKERLFDQMVEMRSSGGDVRAEAMEELAKDTPDKEQLHALVDERMDLWRGAMHNMVDEMVELHGVLTPQQREQIIAIIQEKMDKHHSRH